jgi:hypothetical protein
MIDEDKISRPDLPTLAVKPCCACSGQLIESDQFCRWCGISQAVVKNYSTSLLDQSPVNLYHRVSRPLVDAAVAGVSKSEIASDGRWIRQMLLALIAVPIWLMIVLLSPFDAYAAARNLVRQGR